MELYASDFQVADALKKLGYCIIALNDWTRIVAEAMDVPVANPDVAVPQAIARLRDAKVLDIASWRVCCIGGIWLKLEKGDMPPSHIQEGPITAYAYVLKVDQLAATQERQERGTRQSGGFVRH